MENKKLLHFLLKDLNELDELFEEKEKGSFDNLEMEFLQSRLKSSKKLVHLLLEREKQMLKEINKVTKIEQVEPEKKEEKIEPELHQKEKQEEKEEVIPEKKAPSVEIEEESDFVAKTEEKTEVKGLMVEESSVEVKVETKSTQVEELELEEEEEIENKSKTLGDSFLKEKSVNDLIAGDSGKLEHKLSNRPVESIHTAIGINDRFQYIRELFQGNADAFSKTVSEIDNMKDLKDAVDYLQKNFKWKKTEVSLKFVNLVKRRFTHA